MKAGAEKENKAEWINEIDLEGLGGDKECLVSKKKKKIIPVIPNLYICPFDLNHRMNKKNAWKHLDRHCLEKVSL